MSGSHAGVPQPPTFIAADDRIPFPEPTSCCCAAVRRRLTIADDAITLDGFVDEKPAPGAPDRTTARLRLTISPTGGRIEEMILPAASTTRP